VLSARWLLLAGGPGEGRRDRLTTTADDTDADEVEVKPTSRLLAAAKRRRNASVCQGNRTQKAAGIR
jgi:hypothetical protein